MLLLQDVHYVSCSNFLLYVSIFFVKFANVEIRFLFFPFQIQNSLSAVVVIGGNLYWLIKAFVSFHSERWQIIFLSVVKCEYLKYIKIDELLFHCLCCCFSLLRRKITFAELPDCIHIWSLVFVFVCEWKISDFEGNLYKSNLGNWPVNES